MRYVSTRGKAPELSFEDVLLTGLARDGGLYVPAQWPALSASQWRSLRDRPYHEVATAAIMPFIGDLLSREELGRMTQSVYEKFSHAAVAPLVQLDADLWLMELFHGPTFAFKDYALQLLGHLFDHVLARRGQRLTVLGATSGDTGSAAIEACRGRERIDIFMLYPEGRVSAVQRRQMTTVLDANVHVAALAGSFDDCQAIVKTLFNDPSLRTAVPLGAVNSINWARILAQTVYYAMAALALGAPERAVRFAVPTGNFGNVYAGWVARRMGLPIERLAIGTNRNDVVARFFHSGRLTVGTVEPSLSPSMDIQVSSNLERLLFEMMGRDGGALAHWMAGWSETGEAAIGEERMMIVQSLFHARSVDDALTCRTIEEQYRATGQILDPHSAVAVAAARALSRDAGAPTVALACAHPAKFGETVARAIGREIPLPPRLAAVMTAPEHQVSLAAQLDAVRAFMLDNSLSRNMASGAAE